MNFAAETHVDRSIDDPAAFVRTNVTGDLRAARGGAALPAREPRRGTAFRFLHVSTDEVYGTLGATGAFSETTPYAPNSPYAASKAGADHLVRAYHETYRLPVLLTNCSNNYGPYQFPEKLIPLMILNAVEGKSLPIYGDGGNVRDWLYVEDHCEGILLVLRKGAPGGKYNIGGGNERTNLQVVDALCAALEAELPAARNPALAARGLSAYAGLKTFVPDRPGHDRRYAIDASKIRARARLGAAPRLRGRPARDGALVPREPPLVRGGAVGHVPARAAGPVGLGRSRLPIETERDGHVGDRGHGAAALPRRRERPRLEAFERRFVEARDRLEDAASRDASLAVDEDLHENGAFDPLLECLLGILGPRLAQRPRRRVVVGRRGVPVSGLGPHFPLQPEALKAASRGVCALLTAAIPTSRVRARSTPHVRPRATPRPPAGRGPAGLGPCARDEAPPVRGGEVRRAGTARRPSLPSRRTSNRA